MDHCTNGLFFLISAMLTGESVPVTKTPVSKNEGEVFDARKHLKHTLLRGTEVIQTRSSNPHSEVLAVVVRTGFQTTKGSLVRSIMYPAPGMFKEYLSNGSYCQEILNVLSIFS